MPLTCLADTPFLRNWLREGGEDGGDGEEAKGISEEQERVATKYHWVTLMLEKVTLSEDGSMDTVTLSIVSFLLDGCQQYH